MADAVTADLVFDAAASPSEEAASRRAVRWAVFFSTVVIVGHLPLFLMHLQKMWLFRPHYQFFPLLLAGIAWLLWSRWPRCSAAMQPPRGRLRCWRAACWCWPPACCFSRPGWRRWLRCCRPVG